MDYFDRQILKAYGESYDRRQKMKAQSALTKKFHVETAHFADHFDSWRKNRQATERAAENRIPNPTEIDYDKVKYTLIAQVVNFVITVGLLLSGYYAIATVIGLAGILVNLGILIKAKSE